MAKVIHSRSIENIHIYLWLIKDACWAAHWVIPGLCMIVPTVLAAVWLLVKNRNELVELVHNSAVLLWISANAIWMTAEFLKMEETLKPISFVLFIIGILILSIYYLRKLWLSYR